MRILIAEGRVIAARFGAHRGSLVAGGLAFFVALSVAPAALAVGWIVGLVLTPEQVRQSLTSAAEQSPGLMEQAKPAINAIVSIVESSSSGGVTIASLLGAVLAIYAASRTVLGVRMALNTAFGVPDRYRGIMERVAATVTTLIGMVIAVGLIIVITFLPRILKILGLVDIRLTSGSWLIDWVLLALLVWFAAWLVMAKGANHGGRLPFTALGPIVSAVWITVASAGVGLYAQLSSTTGAAIAIFGSAVVILLWLYFCFIGLLIGAEIEGERMHPSAVAQA